MNDFIYERLAKHYTAAEKFARQHNCQLITVRLRGSQNYGLATPESDVDTIAFILPSREALIFDEKISKELHIDDEHCVVKDIRFLYIELSKGSPNMIEALMTDFYWDNPKFVPFLKSLLAQRESYARINPDKTVDALCGMGFSPTGKHYHATKNLEMIRRYRDGESFKDILVSENVDYLMELKRKNIRDEVACANLREINKQSKMYEFNEEAQMMLKREILRCFKIYGD